LRRPVSSQTASAGPKPPPSQMLLNLSNAAFVRANKTGVAKEDIVNFVHRGTVTVGTGGTLSAPGNTPSPTTPPSAKFPEFAPVDRSREGYVQKARDGSQDVSADGHPSPVSPFKKARSSSSFRGVTLHRRTKRWESHIWVRETGKQLYLGGFDNEAVAAEAHDLCALKIKGFKARGLNFPPEKYLHVAPTLDAMSHEQVVQAVRLGKLTVTEGHLRTVAEGHLPPNTTLVGAPVG